MNKKVIGLILGMSLSANVCFATTNEPAYNVGDIVTTESLNLSTRNGYAVILEEEWVTTRIRCIDMKVVEVDYSKLGYKYKNLRIGDIYTISLDNAETVSTNDCNGFFYITFEEKDNDIYYTRVKLDYDNRIMGITFIDKNL